jgi:hypothetical protein
MQLKQATAPVGGFIFFGQAKKSHSREGETNVKNI